MGPKKTTKSRQSTAVQGTNDSSSVSKSSMVHRGYFQDDFIKHLVYKKKNIVTRSPLINRGYYIRNFAINAIIIKFLKSFSNQNVPCQIISIGSGYDSTYFRLKSENLLSSGSCYIEIDFPELQQRKLSLIKSNERLFEFVGEARYDQSSQKSSVLWNSDSYKMFGCDITDTDQLFMLLSETSINFDTPTLIMSEVVLTYLNVSSANSFISWTSKIFPNSVFITYEQIYPFDEFGEFMCRHFEKLGSSLKSVLTYPTLISQVMRYLEQGWSLCTGSTMAHFYKELLLKEEKDRINSLELFDEYEEWYLKCMHYLLLTASQGSCCDLDSKIWSGDLQNNISAVHEFENVSCSNELFNEILPCRETFIRKTKLDSHSQAVSSLDIFSQKLNCEKKEKICSSVLEYSITADHVVGGNCSRYGHCCSILVAGNKKFMVVVGGFETDTDNDVELQQTDVVEISINRDESMIGKTEISNKGCNSKVTQRYNHRRSRHVKVISLSLDVNQHYFGSPSSFFPLSSHLSNNSSLFERMHSTSTPLNGSRVLILGGRKAPDNACSDALLLEFHQKDESLVLNEVWVADNSGHSGRLRFREQLRGNDISKEDNELSNNVTTESPLPRWRHSAAVVKRRKEKEEIIFVHGGLGGKGIVFGDCWSLSTIGWCWNLVSSSTCTSSPVPCHSHSMVWWKNRNSLVISGGLNSNDQPLKSIHVLNLDSFQWSPFKCQGHLEPRFSHTSHIYKNHLILVGGVSSTYPSPGIDIISLNDGTIRRFNICSPISSEQIECKFLQFHNHASHLITDGDEPITSSSRNNSTAKSTSTLLHDIFIVGGGGNYFSFGTSVRTQALSIRVDSLLSECE